MDSQPCIFLGIKIKPGPIERHKIENFALDNTVDSLKTEAEKKTNVPSASLELIHHGKILKDNHTLQDSGVKSGEMVHVVKKKVHTPAAPAPSYSDAELQQLNTSLRTLGCTPNAPGWTRAMQLLNDESAMAEIIEQAPSIGEDCVALSILHEVELLAALGANIHTMRRGANAHPELPAALRHLTRLVRSRSNTTSSTDSVPTSGFAYSLEALSEDEDADEEENEDGERNPITHEQFAAALQAATEAVSSSSSRGAGSSDSLLRLLQSAGESSRATSAATDAGTPTGAGPARSLITPEMFSEAISEAMNRAGRARTSAGTPMEQSTAASSSQSPVAREGGEDFSVQLNHMHEMGLLDDALNIRALLICAGDVNAAINLVFSGAIGDD
ncbi:ubiquitin-like protein 7 [Trichoplusia ni]|uniref:Ubiquitin-like protein 7 n=1 Tax=Trichoplusia ni TaxID=7111 RepID=A0A7E5WJV0_TRINI|nr:ubiquitin-like protein 7 [Trichoplusia ni]XP_026741076.1 ubiquitin-like protein 7 [Trichoplusia ni]